MDSHHGHETCNCHSHTVLQIAQANYFTVKFRDGQANNFFVGARITVQSSDQNQSTLFLDNENQIYRRTDRRDS